MNSIQLDASWFIPVETIEFSSSSHTSDYTRHHQKSPIITNKPTYSSIYYMSKQSQLCRRWKSRTYSKSHAVCSLEVSIDLSSTPTHTWCLLSLFTPILSPPVGSSSVFNRPRAVNAKQFGFVLYASLAFALAITFWVKQKQKRRIPVLTWSDVLLWEFCLFFWIQAASGE